MTDLSGYRFSTLREGDLTLSRGVGEGLPPILLLAPAAEKPALESIRRLEHEYALSAALDPAWAIRPLALIHRHGRLALMLEDPGGEPLDRLLGPALGVDAFLDLAIPIAAALRLVHERGLIHKDVKPASLFVDPLRGAAWFTGFGIASRLAREHQGPAPPEVIAGTLAYMAPEQTGRMNRSIDSRSDLYALGVTFYEMLTGELPFTAADPMAWVHCHVARQALAPAERIPGIPQQLSAIVMKLLAKTAEERYQTAAGVLADLRRCRASWASHRRIDPFPPGASDASARLMIPERLYGREPEIAALLASFDRVVSHGGASFVLVSGYSGIGKSSLVSELHKELVSPRGLFAAAKFDQYKRNIPYGTLARALQTLVHQILGKSDAELARWRASLLEALGPNGQLMVNLVPELALVIGDPPPAPELPPQDQQARFQHVFRRFLGVFARLEHPLGLFLDDLQWADPASLGLIEHLALHPKVRHLLLVGAYRENEVGPSHPLARMLARLRDGGGRLQEIRLGPFRPEDVERLLADALRTEPARVAPLAALVFEKTGGNPFFTIQFLIALAEESLLTFDAATGQWGWDLPRVRAKGFTDNVADLMTAKLGRLSPGTQNALGVLACLGNAADLASLALVQGVGEEAVAGALWDAVRAGLVLLQGGAYSFTHDRIHEAAYALIAEGERAAAHLRIGRLLADRTPPEGLEERIFDIVNQFDRGAALITAAEERERVACLNLLAGKRAKAATAYAAALQYFAAGRGLLPEPVWERCRDLAFELELNWAECEYLTGDLTAAERRLAWLSLQAGSATPSSVGSSVGTSVGSAADAAAVACLRINLYANLDQSDSAVEVGLDYLRRFDGAWKLHPTAEEVRGHCEALWERLRRASPEALRDLPFMADLGRRATMDVLTMLTSPALRTDVNLFRLVVCRMAVLSLEHGNTDGSSLAYAWLGSILGSYLGDYEGGARFGRLSLDLIETRGLGRFSARTWLVFAVHVAPWTQHLKGCQAFLRRAFEAAWEAGDRTYAAYSLAGLITNLLASGEPLGEVEREARNALDFVQGARFGLMSDVIAAQLALVGALRGQTPSLASLDGPALREGAFEDRLEGNPQLAVAACWYWLRKLQAAVFAEDGAAAGFADKVARLLWTTPTQVELSEYHFYAALAWAAACDRLAGEERADCLRRLAMHHLQIVLWAGNCPATFASRAALVGAEISRLEGRMMEALRLYEESIRLAREQGLVQNEALAQERAAKLCQAVGLATAAQAYLRDARYAYLRWGAEGKLHLLEVLHPHLREDPAAPRPTASIRASVEQLDIGAVVKASQAVSGEIVLSRLLETLMRIALEHAGAEQGMLVLLHGGELRIEAKARTGRQGVEVMLRRTPATSSDLPESMLHTVLRTRQSLILDDARQSQLFAADPYVQRRQPRSVLCLPLVERGRLVGLLYLENNLAPATFTAQRIAVLELLASQAAISLENARLYEDLRRSEAFLAEGERLSQTGSWGWKSSTGELTWSPEYFRILGFDPDTAVASLDEFWKRVHAEDRPALQLAVEGAVRERRDFDSEFRIVLPDGSIRHVHSVGHVVAGDDREQGGRVEFIGTTRDITERKHAEEALRTAQAELARVARLTTMGELAASIAHEINQPLGAIVVNASTALLWLKREAPEIGKAEDMIARIGRDAMRAADVIRGLRALARKTGPELASLDINQAIEEVLTLTRSERQQHRVELHTELFNGQRRVLGDRIQLQQVMLNLIMNGIEAMAGVEDRRRVLEVSSEIDAAEGVLVSVGDTGTGLDPEIAARIFDPFFTTKPDGMGMGLSICRTIVEAHGGRFWASPQSPYGTVFRFTVPAAGAAAEPGVGNVSVT